MKVSELIERLKEMPQDLNVVIDAPTEDEDDLDTFVIGGADWWGNVGINKMGYVYIWASGDLA